MQTDQSTLYGINAVHEALRSGRPIDAVFVSVKTPSGALSVTLAMCKEKGIPIKQVDRRKLDQLCEGGTHQGIIAFVAAYEYASVEDILLRAQERQENPLLVVCDSLEDPHNLGAILRTADAVGAHGVIIPKRRSVSLNQTVAKTAAGALEHVPVARVTNLSATLEALKEAGLWIYGADMQGTPYTELSYNGPMALVIGAEGTGISRIVRAHCDFLVSLPMKGQINSLNASVAAGVLLFAIAKDR